VKSITEVIRLKTRKGLEFIDITENVKDIVARSRVCSGVATIYSRHTTAAIRINESEPLLMRDFVSLLKRLCPANGLYNHDRLDERRGEMCEHEAPNGHAHCLHLLLSTSEHVPIEQGKLCLGRWQRVFLVELDRARDRELMINVLGEAHYEPTNGGARRTGRQVDETKDRSVSRTNMRS
jgi:secondary thiamine-phosphate synthase enzyme